MSVYCTTETLSAYDYGTCPQEPGKIVAIALLEPGYAITDYTLETEWGTDITANLIWLMNPVRGSYTTGDAVTVQGYGLQETKVVGRPHTLSVMAPNTVANRNFFNTAQKKNDLEVAFAQSNGQGWKSEVTVSIDPKLIIPEDSKQEAYWDITITWSDIDLPTVTGVWPLAIYDYAAQT